MFTIGKALKRIQLVVILTALTPVIASGETLSQIAFFTRCYTQLTGKRPFLSHPSRALIKAGTLTGYQACSNLIDKAKLVNGGANDGRLATPADSESVAVLNHMNDYHRSWFASDSIENAVVDTNNAMKRDRMIHDETEPALHVTRALFGKDGSGNDLAYSEIVTQSSAMEALRTSGTISEPTWDGNTGWSNDGSGANGTYIKFRALSLPMDNSCVSCTSIANLNTINSAPYTTYHTNLNAPLVQTGDLLGVRLMSANASKMALSSYSNSGAPISSYTPYPYYYFNQTISVNDSLGGGLTGAKSYLILNLGHPGSTFTDGGLDMPRRWAKAVLAETLCRTVPAIRESDAAPFVEGNSHTLPFRNGRTCMQCHASIDPLGAIARNVSLRPIPEGNYGNWGSSTQLAVHPVIAGLTPIVGQVQKDENYYKRAPDGTLFYRSYNGDKVYVPITGTTSAKDAFTKLGQTLANTNDLYVCAASRYYQKFTGIQVSLQDIGDDSQPTLNANQLKFRNEVIALGLKFKNHKSLRQLILDIMSSPTYQSASPAGGN